MNSSTLSRCIALAALLAVAAGAASAQNWKPTRPINLIVPWAPGGSTDQVTRVTAAELEKALGQTIVVINQPGASGSIGTKSALDAAKDGYTWTAGAAQDLGSYETLGSLKTNIHDWHLFLTVANIQVIGVNPNTPYQNAKQLLDAMKANPGKISVATAGVTSAGHNAMELISKATGVKYRHVTYDGGNPAIVATVAGEADVTTQLAVEQADMSWATRVRRDDLVTFHVDGTDGSAVAGLHDCRVQSKVATPRPVWNPDVKQPMSFHAQWQEIPDSVVYDNGFKIQWEHFIRHVVENEPYRWTLPEGAKGVQLVEAALQSWQERRWVDVPALNV